MALNQKHPQRSEITLKPGDKVALCRCWQSKKFPFCDGCHRDYNDTSQDKLGPIIVHVE